MLVVLASAVMHRGVVLESGETADVDETVAASLIERGLATAAPEPRAPEAPPVVADDASPKTDAPEPSARHPRRKRSTDDT